MDNLLLDSLKALLVLLISNGLASISWLILNHGVTLKKHLISLAVIDVVFIIGWFISYGQ